jgi:hypothetical protein
MAETEKDFFWVAGFHRIVHLLLRRTLIHYNIY